MISSKINITQTLNLSDILLLFQHQYEISLICFPLGCFRLCCSRFCYQVHRVIPTNRKPIQTRDETICFGMMLVEEKKKCFVGGEIVLQSLYIRSSNISFLNSTIATVVYISIVHCLNVVFKSTSQLKSNRTKYTNAYNRTSKSKLKLNHKKPVAVRNFHQFIMIRADIWM